MLHTSSSELDPQLVITFISHIEAARIWHSSFEARIILPSFSQISCLANESPHLD